MCIRDRSVRWHESLVAALQGGLGVHRYGWSAFDVRSTLLNLVVARKFRCSDFDEVTFRAIKLDTAV